VSAARSSRALAADAERSKEVRNRYPWLRLIWRLCALAVMCAATASLWDVSSARADSGTTCAQCDSNNATTQANCRSTYDACIQSCNSNPYPNCTYNCQNNYANCQDSGWTTYDNCLYGFTDFSGVCSVSNQSGQTYTGRGKTPCDYACYDQMRDCRENDGETCGEEFESCKLGCG
jgi:hypothetical protein